MAGERQKRQDLLDAAVASLIALIRDRGADSASGEFGVVVTLDRGEHRRIRSYEMRTIEPAKAG